ncbi:hypothetical protein D3C72_1235850 [compost metagenome]
MAIELRAHIHYRRVGRAGVEPYVEGVWYFLVVGRVVAQDLFRVQIPPRLDAIHFNTFGDFFHQLQRARVQLLRLFVNEQGHRYAPGTLT